MAALDQPLMRAGTVVPDDQIAADLDEIARALAGQRRRRRAGAEQRDRERPDAAGGGTDGARSSAAVEGTAAVDAATVAMKSLRFTTSLPLAARGNVGPTAENRQVVRRQSLAGGP